MSRYRNPFKIRASEKLETESSFLRMYSPMILETLIDKNQEGKLWDNVLFLRSSPGAGKTSLLRIFDPTTLLTLFNNKSVYKDILQYLKKLEVIDDDSINLIGVYLSCVRNYELLEDLELKQSQKKRLFFALINARIILSALRSILTLKPRLSLEDIQVDFRDESYSYIDLEFPCSGRYLSDWAVAIEKNVFKALDSFLPIEDAILSGHSELFAFEIMKPENISMSGTKLTEKFLFMIDDTHKLSTQQRDFLLSFLAQKRGNYNVWIAERLEALDAQENFGSYRKRDYDEINLEEIWQEKFAKFKNIVANVALKRASMSSQELTSFQDYLNEELNEHDCKDKLIKSVETSLTNLKKIASYTHLFDNWIKYIVNSKEPEYDKAVLARAAEIIIYRNLGKPQLTLEFALPENELLEKIQSEIRSAATYLMSVENKIPYYFGFDSLVRLSSNNIEQFLSFSSELYEVMLSRKIADNSINLSAEEQEKIIRKVVDEKWKEQSRLVYADNVLKFLHNISVFAQKETNKPSAPYAPGVTGFAISEKQTNKLIKVESWEKDEAFVPLINVLSSCVSLNLLEKRQVKQGKVGQTWTVYYLNRWLCVKYNLPLSYGGWRHKTPTELLKWTK